MRKFLFLLVNIFFVILTIPVAIYIKIIPGKHRRLVEKATYSWAVINLKIFGHKPKIIGELPPLTKGYAIYVNHESILDIWVMLYLFQGKTGFIAKKEVSKIPFIGFWIKAMGGNLIDRSSMKAGVASINEGAESIKAGYNITIFPEGTRNIHDEEFKAGSFKLALKAEADIIPITIRGTAASWEKNNTIATSESTIYIHEILKFHDFKDEKMTNLALKIQNLIQKQK